jgi:hypothetical protein
LRFFHRKKTKGLSELQGVPDGTFRCDVCRFVQPLVCLCGAVADAAGDLPPKTYILCGVCARWLGFKEPRFPQGLCFNFSAEQREKIRALHEELDTADNEISLLTITTANVGCLENLHEFLERVPNLRQLIRFRSSLLSEDIIELSGRLTRGESVATSEIGKVNA